MEDLNDYMLLHGHSRAGEFNFNDELIEAIKAINELDIPELNGVEIKYITRHKLKKQAYMFFNDFYNLHKIGYLSDKKLKSILSDKRIQQIEDITNIYNSSATFINPLKLPINYVLDNYNGGTLVTQAVLTEDHELHKQLLPNMNVYFTSIKLPTRPTDVVTSSYIHEITHSQLESYKGIIEEFNNAEVLSIFNELLYAYNYCDKKIFDVLLVNRLNSLFMCFNSIYKFKTTKSRDNILEDEEYSDFNYQTDIKYMISTLKALKMFSLCCEDHITKYHIINLVNKVFNGEFTVEELLDKLNINQENIIETDHIKKIIK